MTDCTCECHNTRGHRISAMSHAEKVRPCPDCEHTKTHARAIAKAADNHRANERRLEAEVEALERALALLAQAVPDGLSIEIPKDTWSLVERAMKRWVTESESEEP